MNDIEGIRQKAEDAARAMAEAHGVPVRLVVKCDGIELVAEVQVPIRRSSTGPDDGQEPHIAMGKRDILVGEVTGMDFAAPEDESVRRVQARFFRSQQAQAAIRDRLLRPDRPKVKGLDPELRDRLVNGRRLDS